MNKNIKSSKKRINKCISVLLVICLLISSGSKVFASTRSFLEDEDKKEKKEITQEIDYSKTHWKLKELYPNDKEWEDELKKLKNETIELKNYIGKVTKSKTHLVFALDIKEKLDIKLIKLSAYVKLNKDIAKDSYVYLDLNDKLSEVYRDYSKICSAFELEILNLTEKEYEEIISNNIIKSKYGNYLDGIRNSKEHYLDEKSEMILSDIGQITNLPGEIYNLFRNMDKKSELTPSEYAVELECNDRDRRKKAYTNEFLTYNDNINMLAGLLEGQVTKNVFYSQQRGYESSLGMYLECDEVDKKVYDNLISTVNENLGSLHKYVKLRKEYLGLDKIKSYDMFVPIAQPKNSYIPYNKAQDIIYMGLTPLGKEYNDVVYKAFNQNWIDVYSNENKVSGGYCLSIYDEHPFILMNYSNSLSSVSTLAHELGHAVYGYMSAKNQNYYNSYPSIFTHEVASITNEALMYEMLIKNTENKQDKAYYITQYMDMIKNTLFTQTMYSEFEKYIHETIENEKPLNALVLNDKWGELLTKYYGKDYEVDQLSKVGWARIPHFYDSFYVYQYATGCSAAITFSENIMKNGSEEYIEFLKEGGSKPPVETLQNSGINLMSNKPTQQAINKFNSLLKQLEELI